MPKDKQYKSLEELMYLGVIVQAMRTEELKNEMMKKLSTMTNSVILNILERSRDGQNHHMLMILKSKSNHLNKGDLKSKSKSFWKW